MRFRTPSVRRSHFGRRSFIREGPVSPISKTETPLEEHNGPEKPGRWHAPKGPHSSIASQSGHLAFAHSASAGCAPADVLGRRSDTSSTNQMDTSTSTTANRPHHSTAHTRSTAGGRKSTPFVPRLTLRAGIANHQKAEGVPTLPTLPTGVEQRGRKSTPPFGNARAHWQRPRVGKAGTGWSE